MASEFSNFGEYDTAGAKGGKSGFTFGFGDIADFVSDPFGIGERRRQEQAERAARAAQQGNLGEAIRLWENYRGDLEQIRNPFDEQFVRGMTTQQRDITGAAAANEAEQARRLAGASGLGRGGGLANRERMIREEMARRNAAAAGDIRRQAAVNTSQFDRQMADMRGQANAAISNIYSNAPVSLAPISGTAGQMQPDLGMQAANVNRVVDAGRGLGMTENQLNNFFQSDNVYDPIRGGFRTAGGEALDTSSISGAGGAINRVGLANMARPEEAVKRLFGGFRR